MGVNGLYSNQPARFGGNDWLEREHPGGFAHARDRAPPVHMNVFGLQPVLVSY